MKKSFIKTLFTGLFLSVLLLNCSCEKEKKITQEDLLGTWVYDDDTNYAVTFMSNGKMAYQAPSGSPSYNPTWTLNDKLIVINVQVGSATVSDVVEIRSLSGSKLLVYYDGELLFEGKSLNGEYSLTKK